MESNKFQKLIKVKVKENMILTLTNLTDFKYWKSVYQDAEIIPKYKNVS